MSQLKRKTQSERKERSTRALIQSLTEIINTEGVGAATCENIGQRAGVSRGLVIQRLGKKHKMLDTFIHEQVQMHLQRLSDANVKNHPTKQALKTYIDIHFDSLLEAPGYRALYVLIASSITTSLPSKAIVEEAQTALCQQISNSLRNGIENKEVSATLDTDSAAAHLCAYLLGAAIQSQISGFEIGALFKPGAYKLAEHMVI